MKFNVLGLILKLKLMPKISTDTFLSKSWCVTGHDQKRQKTNYNWSRTAKNGPVQFFDASDI